jgi:hypothetical protein
MLGALLAQSKVKGSGQECPLHTSWSSALA